MNWPNGSGGGGARLRYVGRGVKGDWCDDWSEDDFEKFETKWGDRRDGVLCSDCKTDPEALAEYEGNDDE